MQRAAPAARCHRLISCTQGAQQQIRCMLLLLSIDETDRRPTASCYVGSVSKCAIVVQFDASTNICVHYIPAVDLRLMFTFVLCHCIVSFITVTVEKCCTGFIACSKSPWKCLHLLLEIQGSVVTFWVLLFVFRLLHLQCWNSIWQCCSFWRLTLYFLKNWTMSWWCLSVSAIIIVSVGTLLCL